MKHLPLVLILFSMAMDPLMAAKAKHSAKLPHPMVLEKGEGSYHAFSITLHRIELPFSGRPHLRGVLRDGKSMVPGPRSLREKAGKIQLKGSKLEGDFTWRLYVTDLDVAVQFKATVDAAGRLEGSWTAVGYQVEHAKKDKVDWKGRLSGWLRTHEQLQAMNAIDSQASWSSWLGSDHNLQGMASKTPLVEELKEARLMWRSEASIPTGQGNGVPFGRRGKVPRALDYRSLGGGAGPVLYDGRLYLHYTLPTHGSGHREPHLSILANTYDKLTAGSRAKKKSKKEELSFDMDDDLDFDLEEDGPEKKAREMKVKKDRLPLYAAEKYTKLADDVLLCVEASTGRTLWKATFPKAGVNWQDHKTGPVNLSACVDDKAVYFTNTTGRVLSLDRITGKLLWTAHMPTAGDVATKTPYTGNYHAYDDNFCQSPLLVGDTLLVPDHQFTLYAFDRQTGKELWRKKDAVGRTVTPIPWEKDGEPYVLTLRKIPDPKDLEENLGMCFQLVRLRDGEILWSEKGEFSRVMALGGDTLVVYGKTVEEYRKGPLVSADLYGFTITPEKPQPLWHSVLKEAPFLSMNSLPVIVGERVITTSKDGYRALDLKSGKTLHSLPGQGGSKMAVSVVSGDHLITRIDSAHGTNQFVWLRDIHGAFTRAKGGKDRDGNHTGLWGPPHPHTNSYSSKPMIFNLADGRFFLRGADGLYCYDLRAQP